MYAPLAVIKVTASDNTSRCEFPPQSSEEVLLSGANSANNGSHDPIRLLVCLCINSSALELVIHNRNPGYVFEYLCNINLTELAVSPVLRRYEHLSSRPGGPRLEKDSCVLMGQHRQVLGGFGGQHDMTDLIEVRRELRLGYKAIRDDRHFVNAIVMNGQSTDET